MEKVDKYIGELLYEHDCVIVPSFGGFVANYTSAKVNAAKHSFSPPSKSLVFNKNLKTNDGLLANHIAISEKSNYPQALKYIHEFVDVTQAELKKGKKVTFDNIGVFSLDIERNIQFEPSTHNYLQEAFGLPQFQAKAIQRDTVAKQLKKEFKDRSAIPQEKRKINIKRVVALTIAVPLIAALFWIPLKTDLLKNVDYASLNPFAKKEKPIEVNKNNSEDVVLPTKENASKENTLTTTAENIVKPVVADSTSVASTTKLPDELKFHLVAGCFQIESNAVNFVNTLREKNIEASIIGKNDKGLFVVSCGNYATRNEATNNLKILRQQQPDAWLYKNN
jgi:nucleoid DNA-binding protein